MVKLVSYIWYSLYKLVKLSPYALERQIASKICSFFIVLYINRGMNFNQKAGEDRLI